jgi:hypothetical protein
MIENKPKTIPNVKLGQYMLNRIDLALEKLADGRNGSPNISSPVSYLVYLSAVKNYLTFVNEELLVVIHHSVPAQLERARHQVDSLVAAVKVGLIKSSDYMLVAKGIEQILLQLRRHALTAAELSETPAAPATLEPSISPESIFKSPVQVPVHTIEDAANSQPERWANQKPKPQNYGQPWFLAQAQVIPMHRVFSVLPRAYQKALKQSGFQVKKTQGYVTLDSEYILAVRESVPQKPCLRNRPIIAVDDGCEEYSFGQLLRRDTTQPGWYKVLFTDGSIESVRASAIIGEAAIESLDDAPEPLPVAQAIKYLKGEPAELRAQRILQNLKQTKSGQYFMLYHAIPVTRVSDWPGYMIFWLLDSRAVNAYSQRIGPLDLSNWSILA